MWKDDSQVVDALVKKRYSARPRIEVKIKQLDNQCAEDVQDKADCGV
ncbi:RusA family crossover junction endodeoxyribonuclease [Paenibacillus sp. FSL R7-0333]